MSDNKQSESARSISNRELDMLVAEKVMGYFWCGRPVGLYSQSYDTFDSYWLVPPDTQMGVGGYSTQAHVVGPLVPVSHMNGRIGRPADSVLPSYSFSIAAAWDVIERLRELPFTARYRFAEALKCAVPANSMGEFVEWPWAILLITPRQICECALEAMEGK